MFFKNKKELETIVDYSSEDIQTILMEFSKVLYEVGQYYEEQIAKYESIIENMKNNG